MRLAYYEEHDYHTEIMGLFLDFCLSNNHTFDYFNDKDQSYFLEHYTNLFTELQINRYKNLDLLDKINDYDYVIVGTMGSSCLIDNLILSNPNKFLQIFHNEDDLKKIGKNINNAIHTKKIVLTPLNTKVAPYLLPIFDSIYKEKEKVKEKEKILVIVGRFTDHRSYESLIPLLNMDYTIWVIARRPKFVPAPLVEISQKNPKLKISYKLDAQKMSQVLLRAKYILCVAEDDSWYYKDRLTGTIPLSYNYNLPIVIPSKLNKIYDIKGSIPYDEPELIPDLIKNIDSVIGKYEELQDIMMRQKLSIVENNRKQLSTILN